MTVVSSSLYGDPRASLFRDLLQVDLALLIAYSVATAGASISVTGSLKDHLDWLGTTCSIGAAGAISVALNVGLAAYVEAGHSGFPTALGLSWIFTASLLLGFVVAMLPWATYEWSKAAKKDPSPAQGDPQERSEAT